VNIPPFPRLASIFEIVVEKRLCEEGGPTYRMEQEGSNTNQRRTPEQREWEYYGNYREEWSGMDARHRGIQVLGWLSVIAGYGLALLLIRGVFIGITRGFGAGRSQAFWILLGYLVFVALAIYPIRRGTARIIDCERLPSTRSAVWNGVGYY
jgi:hypothetical protein